MITDDFETLKCSVLNNMIPFIVLFVEGRAAGII